MNPVMLRSYQSVLALPGKQAALLQKLADKFS